MTYTLTIDFTNITLPSSYIYYFNTYDQVGTDNAFQDTPDAAMVAIGQFYQTTYGGTFSFTNIGNVYTLTMDLTTEPNNGPSDNLQFIVFGNDNGTGTYWSIQRGEQESTLCPTCMAMNIVNCEAVEIELPLPNDDYTVKIVDNQTGVEYTQWVQWTNGVGTWNTTNTAGVFTPFTIYTLTVFDSSDQPVSWTVGPNEYTCGRMMFTPTVDTNVDG